MDKKLNDIGSATVRIHNERNDRRRRPRIDWHYWPPTGQASTISHNLGISSRPDIEDEPLIAWGLSHSESTECSKVKVDVLYGHGKALSGVRIFL